MRKRNPLLFIFGVLARRLKIFVSITMLVCLGYSEIQEKFTKPYSYWGMRAGYLFTSIPISSSEFSLPLTDFFYSRSFVAGTSGSRPVGTLGIYGFNGLIPIPRIGVEYYVGPVQRAIQPNLGLSGFYDFAIGGHAGASVDLGITIHNAYDLNFKSVLVGKDADVSYRQFGTNQGKNPDCDCYVDLPYFALFFGVRF